MKLTIDFAGWLEIEAKDVSFQYIGTDESKPQIINGKEYNKLNENEQSEYIIENFAQALLDATNVDYDWLYLEFFK